MRIAAASRIASQKFKRNMLFGAYRPIIDYLEYFGLTDKVGQLFAETLPSLTSSMTSLIQNGGIAVENIEASNSSSIIKPDLKEGAGVNVQNLYCCEMDLYQ